MQRVANIVLWTVVVAPAAGLALAFLYGFIMGLLRASPPESETFYIVFLTLLTLGLPILALILAILGVLPGTRKRPRRQEMTETM